jgi:hypothetical protein
MLRASQLPQIITLATTPQEQDMPLTDADVAAVATAVWNRFTITNPAGAEVHLVDALEVLLKDGATPPPSGSVDYPTLAKAVVDELASRAVNVNILGKA